MSVLFIALIDRDTITGPILLYCYKFWPYQKTSVESFIFLKCQSIVLRSEPFGIVQVFCSFVLNSV